MPRAGFEQAINVWVELEDAYSKRNRFAGDTAEIYFHLLLQYNESYIRTEGDHNSDLVGDYNFHIDASVISDLKEIFTLFSEKRGCSLYIDGVDFEEWEPEVGNFHRIEVKVEPWEGRE